MSQICVICGLLHTAVSDKLVADTRAVAEGLNDPIASIETLTHCVSEQRVAMRRLLDLVAGSPVECRGCPAMIYWVTHKNGKRTPYTAAGLNHFLDCPASAQFRKGAAKQ